MPPLVKTKTNGVHLQQGEYWPSFEQFRSQGNTALRKLERGAVGTLATKHGQFRILTEADFQHLYGLAREVERLSGTLHVVAAAARSVQRHQDASAVETLTAAVMLLGDPSLPTRTALEPLEPEGFAVDDVDDLDLDNIPRPNLERAG